MALDENHAKYKGELYALIVGLTTGEAKCVVRDVNEKGWESDGFLALVMLQARYDANTAASLLQCVMEVVNPPALKNHQGIVKGINEWEVRLDGLKMKHNEDISPRFLKNIRTCVSNKQQGSQPNQPLKQNMLS